MPAASNLAPLVTIGFVVKRRYRKEQGGRQRRYESRVSQRFMSRAAAEDFRNLAERVHEPQEGELDVRYFVTNDIGVDGIQSPE